MRTVVFGIAASVALLACASGKRTALDAPLSGRVVPLSAAVPSLPARELPAQPTFAFMAPDASFHARIESRRPPAVSSRQGVTRVVAELGDGAEIACTVYGDVHGAAALLDRHAAAQLSRAGGSHSFQDVHGDEVAGRGYLVARASYDERSANGARRGDYKVAAGIGARTTVICELDAPGLYASFERVVRTLLGSLVVRAVSGGPRLVDASITRVRVPGRMVGIEHSSLHEHGERLLLQSSTARLTLGGGAIHAVDVSRTLVHEGGRLVAGRYASAIAGETEHALELTLDGSVYRVRGTVQDKPVASDFAVAEGLPDPERLSLLMCAVRDREKSTAQLLEYRPEADPVAPTALFIEASPRDRSQVVASLGESRSAKSQLSLDARCKVERGAMQIGSLRVELERLWEHHAP